MRNPPLQATLFSNTPRSWFCSFLLSAHVDAISWKLYHSLYLFATLHAANSLWERKHALSRSHTSAQKCVLPSSHPHFYTHKFCSFKASPCQDTARKVKTLRGCERFTIRGLRWELGANLQQIRQRAEGVYICLKCTHKNWESDAESDKHLPECSFPSPSHCMSIPFSLVARWDQIRVKTWEWLAQPKQKHETKRMNYSSRRLCDIYTMSQIENQIPVCAAGTGIWNERGAAFKRP